MGRPPRQARGNDEDPLLQQRLSPAGRAGPRDLLPEPPPGRPRAARGPRHRPVALAGEAPSCPEGREAGVRDDGARPPVALPRPSTILPASSRIPTAGSCRPRPGRPSAGCSTTASAPTACSATGRTRTARRPCGWRGSIGVPVALIVGGSDVLLLPEQPARRRRCFVEVLSSVHEVQTVSEDLRSKVIELGIDPDRVHVALQGVDPTLFSPGEPREARRRLGPPGGRPRRSSGSAGWSRSRRWTCCSGPARS